MLISTFFYLKKIFSAKASGAISIRQELIRTCKIQLLAIQKEIKDYENVNQDLNEFFHCVELINENVKNLEDKPDNFNVTRDEIFLNNHKNYTFGLITKMKSELKLNWTLLTKHELFIDQQILSNAVNELSAYSDFDEELDSAWDDVSDIDDLIDDIQSEDDDEDISSIYEEFIRINKTLQESMRILKTFFNNSTLVSGGLSLQMDCHPINKKELLDNITKWIPKIIKELKYYDLIDQNITRTEKEILLIFRLMEKYENYLPFEIIPESDQEVFFSRKKNFYILLNQVMMAFQNFTKKQLLVRRTKQWLDINKAFFSKLDFVQLNLKSLDNEKTYLLMSIEKLHNVDDKELDSIKKEIRKHVIDQNKLIKLLNETLNTKPRPDPNLKQKLINDSESLLIKANAQVQQMQILLSNAKNEMTFIWDLICILKPATNKTEIIEQKLIEHDNKLKSLLKLIFPNN